MIARPDSRRKGLATEALKLMMGYGIEVLGLRKFVAKIKDENEASRNLFVDKLGYTETSHCDYFKAGPHRHESSVPNQHHVTSKHGSRIDGRQA